MLQFSSTQAKQCFGQLLQASVSGPVAIEKHGKVKAILASPERFAQAQQQGVQQESRLVARMRQAAVEKDRLIRHHRIALDLALFPADRARALVQQARGMVEKWRDGHLCSSDYIERWEQVLNLAPKKMAEVIVSDMDGWGTAMRQNSPWVGVHA